MSLRRLNRRILILCEGVTERLYAAELKAQLPRNLQRSISIEIAQGDQQNPLSLVREANGKARIARKEKNPYEAIWLFFDHDNWSQLRDTFEIIHREAYHFSFTALCIEHWFILHFEDCGREFQTGEDVERHLRRFWPEYHKTKINHFQALKPRLSIATERALRINGRQLDYPVFQRNPFCSIPDLIDFYESLKIEK